MPNATAAEPLVDQFNDPYLKYLSKGELGKILDKSERSIDRLRRKRIIPFVKIGGEVRFRLEDVERALERYTVKEIAL